MAPTPKTPKHSLRSQAAGCAGESGGGGAENAASVVAWAATTQTWLHSWGLSLPCLGLLLFSCYIPAQDSAPARLGCPGPPPGLCDITVLVRVVALAF